MKFKFMNRVRVTEGFYEGFTGKIDDYYGEPYNLPLYVVRLDGVDRTLTFSEEQLEKIER